MTLRVMFVDDEPNVLDGLRRLLRPLRDEWEMRFLPGGAAALDAMAADPADVLVTDMRMPGMDGDELLAAVSRLHPLTVRLVLTGQCTRQAMFRLVRLAHRVFTKPCDPDQLRAAVRSACSLRDLLTSPALAALVGKLGNLPTTPALYNEIVAELERPDGSAAAVGALIARDPGMSAKLMQMAGSSLFSLRRSPATPAQAVQALGVETTKSLVLVSKVLTQYDPAALRPFSIDDLWEHSGQVAALAGAIGQAAGGAGTAAEARLAGLFHDIGRLVLAAQQPEVYREVLRLAGGGRLTVVAAEREVLGATHAEVGAYLLGLWGLPGPTVEAVAWHHAPSGSPANGFGALTALHAAEAILAPGEGGPADAAHLERIGLGDRLPRWTELRARADQPGANA